MNVNRWSEPEWFFGHMPYDLVPFVPDGDSNVPDPGVREGTYLLIENRPTSIVEGD